MALRNDVFKCTVSTSKIVKLLHFSRQFLEIKNIFQEQTKPPHSNCAGNRISPPKSH